MATGFPSFSPSSVPYHRCYCPSGFEGPTCGVDTDDCVKHACVNGGVCVDGTGNYTCRCPLQYTGKHCGVQGIPNPAGMPVSVWAPWSLASLPLAPSSLRKGL